MLTKRIAGWFLIAYFLVSVSAARGHLCDNVFRQADKLIVKPENYNLVVRDRATFKIFLQNNMDRAIAEISLLAESPAFDFVISPRKMSVPKDQRVFFEVTMIPKSGISSGNYPVNFRLVGGGRQFKSFNLDVAGSGAGQEPDKRAEPAAPAEASQPLDTTLLLSVRKNQQSPQIDGKLTDPCWKSSGVASNFSGSAGSKAVYQTVALLTFDQTALYLGFYCRDDNPEKLSDKDWIEVRIAANASGFPYYALVLPALGAPQYRKVFRTGDTVTWSQPGVSYAVSKGLTSWSAELLIPFSSLAVSPPSSRTVWSLRITRMKGSGSPEQSFWAADATGYNNEQGFGQIVLIP